MRRIAAIVVLLAVAAGDASALAQSVRRPEHTHAQPPRRSELGVRDDCLRCLLDAYERLPEKDPGRDQLLNQMGRLMMQGSSPLDPLERNDDAPATAAIPTVWPGWTIQEIPTDTSASIVLCSTLYLPSVFSPGVVVRFGPIRIRTSDPPLLLGDPQQGSPPN
jgi:hypothetical protein